MKVKVKRLNFGATRLVDLITWCGDEVIHEDTYQLESDTWKVVGCVACADFNMLSRCGGQNYIFVFLSFVIRFFQESSDRLHSVM